MNDWAELFERLSCGDEELAKKIAKNWQGDGAPQPLRILRDWELQSLEKDAAALRRITRLVNSLPDPPPAGDRRLLVESIRMILDWRNDR